MFLSMGIPREQIITEDRSRDTEENARYTGKIAHQHGFKKIVLVTSAFHMKRSVMLFGKYFDSIVPYPVGFRTETRKRDLLDFLPDAGSLYEVRIASKEHLGILLYKLTR